MSALDVFFAKKDRKKKGNKAIDALKNEKGDSTSKKTADITDNFKYINDVSKFRKIA